MKIQKIWKDVKSGRNLDIYFTILISLMIAILGAFGITNITIISAAVLATLALIANTLLENRHKDETIKDLLNDLKNDRVPSESFLRTEYFGTNKDLMNALPSGDRAFFWGFIMERTIPLLRDNIEIGMKNGLNVKFLLLKPESNAVKMEAFRTYCEVKSQDYLEKSIARINSKLTQNLSELKELSQLESQGKLEVRVIDYLPPWNIFAVYPKKENAANLFLNLHAFRVLREKRPAIRLNSAQDKNWFDFFEQQFEAVWEEADVIE